MIRATFNTEIGAEELTVHEHPYWVLGFGGGVQRVAAYADSLADLQARWGESLSDATLTEVDEYLFNDRFPCPDWFGRVDVDLD